MKHLILMVVPLMALGCRGMEGMVEERWSDEGTSVTYKIGKKRALEVAKDVMKDEGADGFRVMGEYVIGRWDTNVLSLISYSGSFTGVYAKETEAGCSLRVLSRRRNPLSIFTGLTEGGFHDAFQLKLKGMSQGSLQ